MRTLACLVVLAAWVAAENWPYPRGDLGNSGVTKNRGPEKQPEVLWKKEEAGPIGSGAALAEGKLVYNCGELSMGCRLQNSGFEVWNFDVKQQVVAWPSIVNGIAYFGGQDTVHYGVRMDSRGEACASEAKGAIVAPPAVTEDRYLAGALDGVFYAMSAKDGRVLWQRETGPVRHAAAVVQDRVFVVNETGVLYALDLRKGGELWKHPAGAAPLAAPSPTRALVYLVLADTVLEIDARKGEVKKTHAVPGIAGAPALEKTRLHFGTTGGEVAAVDLRTGRELGRAKVADEAVSTPLVLAKGVLYGAAQARLFAVTTKGWKVLWTHEGEAVWQAPMVADRTLFAGAGTVFHALR